MDINRKKYSGKTRYGEMTIEKKGMMVHTLGDLHRHNSGSIVTSKEMRGDNKISLSKCGKLNYKI